MVPGSLLPDPIVLRAMSRQKHHDKKDIAANEQRARGRFRGQDIPFKGMPKFLQ